ncbi:retron St85 family effector protein [Microbulbifer sp. CnH-101-E]|uniref:retron St85 family effector protein n=1 Tax=unclassified Microbulbifer TaxID=2619833 RepID=UPI0040393E97
MSSLTLEGMRFELSDNPIVLLCGGYVPESFSSGENSSLYASVRHALSSETPDFELFRPEEITDWQSDGIYKNLIDFERDLVGVCSLVVIALESPGSIAELGAFSQLDELKERLLVFVSAEFSTNSFIELGILRHIRDRSEGSVRSYPWALPAEGESISVGRDIINDMLQDAKEQLGRMQKTKRFRADNTAHIMALIRSLIEAFIALKFSEIKRYLRYFEVQLADDELKRKLFLLQKFKLIIKDTYSDTAFYCCSKLEKFHSMRYEHKKGKKVDMLRVTASCSTYYALSEEERHRKGFLKLRAKSAGKE